MRGLGVFVAALALAGLPLSLVAGPQPSTPTPSPGAGSLTGSAHIYGNIFHPLEGGLLPLSYSEPYASTVDIDIYDRLGRLVKHLGQTAGPGDYTLQWDGRGDDGGLVSAGIYEAFFQGQGLHSLVKFAVIK